MSAQGERVPACPVCGASTSSLAFFHPHPLRGCESCGFAFLDHASGHVEYDEAYFENYAGGDYLQQEGQRRHESRRRLDWLARLCPPPARVLEVGAAAGFFLDEARMRGYDGFGIEPNAAMAAHAAQKLGL